MAEGKREGVGKALASGGRTRKRVPGRVRNGSHSHTVMTHLDIFIHTDNFVRELPVMAVPYLLLHANKTKARGIDEEQQ